HLRPRNPSHEHELRGHPRVWLPRPRRQHVHASPSLVVCHRGPAWTHKLETGQPRDGRRSLCLPQPPVLARHGSGPSEGRYLDSTGGSPAGLWIVNDEYGFPRQLFDATVVHSFSWSPSGDWLLIQGQDESWVQFTPGSPAAPLTFKGVWAAALAAGMGYVYIDDSGVLPRRTVSGGDDVIMNEVEEAAVAPNGLRVAFIHRTSNANEVWGYDVGLRASYL